MASISVIRRVCCSSWRLAAVCAFICSAKVLSVIRWSIMQELAEEVVKILSKSTGRMSSESMPSMYSRLGNYANLQLPIWKNQATAAS